MASVFNRSFRGFKKLLQQPCKKTVEEPCKKRVEEDQLPEQVQTVNWDQLCNDILQEIISKLNLRDRLRMSMVCKSWRSSSYDDDDYEGDDDYDDMGDVLNVIEGEGKFMHGYMRGFEVLKIGFVSNTCISTTRLNSLDDGILFVGPKSSSSVVGSDFHGLKKNCIFVLDEFHQFLSNNSGVFYFEDGRFERSFPTEKNVLHCQTCWFSPNL